MSDVVRLRSQIAELNLRANSLSLQISGLHQMYNAACIIANTRDMDNLREQLHALLDQQLDQNASLFMLTRQLIQAQSPGGENPGY